VPVEVTTTAKVQNSMSIPSQPATELAVSSIDGARYQQLSHTTRCLRYITSTLLESVVICQQSTGCMFSSSHNTLMRCWDFTLIPIASITSQVKFLRGHPPLNPTLVWVILFACNIRRVEGYHLQLASNRVSCVVYKQDAQDVDCISCFFYASQ
jgi:hypothetical protein